MRDVSVVIPVRDAVTLLGPCLDAVMSEAAGAEVVVVDDGSTDGSAELAQRRGATVLRAGGAGPYRARNLGWRHTSTELLVLTDVRCRPHPGWLDGLRAGMKDPTVAVAGGDVVAMSGTGAAQRYVAKWQPLAPEHGLKHPFLPFLPTCNIVTRRSVLEDIHGFREIRSGGDLDFCWRVQLAGLGSIAYAADAGVDWVPRETVREVLRQWYRYGSAKPSLWAEYAQHGLSLDPSRNLARFAVGHGRLLVRELRASRPRDWDVAVLGLMCQLAYERGYRAQQRRQRVGT